MSSVLRRIQARHSASQSAGRPPQRTAASVVRTAPIPNPSAGGPAVIRGRVPGRQPQVNLQEVQKTIAQTTATAPPPASRSVKLSSRDEPAPVSQPKQTNEVSIRAAPSTLHSAETDHVKEQPVEAAVAALPPRDDAEEDVFGAGTAIAMVRVLGESFAMTVLNAITAQKLSIFSSAPQLLACTVRSSVVLLDALGDAAKDGTVGGVGAQIHVFVPFSENGDRVSAKWREVDPDTGTLTEGWVTIADDGVQYVDGFRLA